MLKYFAYSFLITVLIACTNDVQNEKDAFFTPKKEERKVDRITELTDSLKNDPKNIDLWIAKGDLCRAALDFSCALDAGAKAYMIDSTNIEARILYAWTLMNKPDAPVTDIETARRHFKYVLSFKPNNPEALVNLANTYSLTGEFKTAIKYINDALKIDEYYRDGYVLKGSIYKILEKNDLALSSYQTALQIDPKYFIGQLNTAWLLTSMENHQLALEYYQNAAELQPENINALYGIAKSFQDLEKYENALHEYKHIISIEPSFYIAFYNQGFIKQYYQNDLDSAAYFYDQTLSINPEYTRAWYQLGNIYFDKDRRSEAAKAYSNALRIDKDYTPAREAAERLRTLK